MDISFVSGHCPLLVLLRLLLLNAPQLKCAISHSNVKQTVRRRMYDPPWHLSSFLSQMCKHYYPWVILSGVVKIRSLPSLLLARRTIKNTTNSGDRGSKRQSEAVGKSNGNGADVCVAVDLWCDKGATQAAGIDGLLVRTGPL